MDKILNGLASALVALGISSSASFALTSISFDTLVSTTFDPSSAVTATFNGQTGTGSISYDETLGLSAYSGADLTFSLMMFGQSFGSTDDEFGSAEYDPNTGDLSFSVSEVSLFNVVDIDLVGLESFAFGSPITPQVGGGNIVEVTAFEGTGACVGCTPPPVPLPASLPLVLSGLGLMGWVSRRRSA